MSYAGIYRGRWRTPILVATACATICIFSGPACAVSYDRHLGGDGGGTLDRLGNTLTYRWIHAAGTREIPFGITCTVAFDHVQSVYRRLPHDEGSFDRYIGNDPYVAELRGLARGLRDLAAEHVLSVPELALSFVQSLPYDDSNHNYQRYCFETLLDATGDCSDTAVLYAALLRSLGIGCVLLSYDDHLAVGVWGDATISGTYWPYGGRRYFYAETTGWGWKIGECPEKRHTSAELILVQ